MKDLTLIWQKREILRSTSETVIFLARFF